MKRWSAIIGSALVIAILAASLLALPASAAQKSPDTSRQPPSQTWYEKQRAYWASTDGLCKGDSVLYKKDSGCWSWCVKKRGIGGDWATWSTDGANMDWLRCSGVLENNNLVYHAETVSEGGTNRVDVHWDSGNCNVPTGNWKSYAGHEYIRGNVGQYGWSDPLDYYSYSNPGGCSW